MSINRRTAKWNNDQYFVHGDGAVPLTLLFGDTETVSFHPPPKGQLVEVAFVNEAGEEAFHELVKPPRPIGNAKQYVGITDEMLPYENPSMCPMGADVRQLLEIFARIKLEISKF